MDENKIITLLRKKDENGLIEFNNTFHGYVKYIVTSILTEYPQDVEECINDVNLKVWQSIDEYNEARSSLKTFVTHIARTTAIDRLRKIKNRKKYFTELDEDSYESIQSDYSTEEIFIQKEFQKELRSKIIAQVDKLRKREQELFVRRYYYRQPIRQIAAEMALSEKAVEKIRNPLKPIRLSLAWKNV